MNLYDAVPEIYKRKWSYISNFTVQINFAQKIDEVIGWSKKIGSDSLLNIKELTTPQFTASSIEQFIGDRWFFHNGKDELFTFNITFRDQDQMLLYRMFTNAFVAQKKMYFNDCKLEVIITKDADYTGEVPKKLLLLKDCMISSVSSLSISNETEAQIAEFSVDFRCRSPIVLNT